jgi:WD40 repeat protein
VERSVFAADDRHGQLVFVDEETVASMRGHVIRFWNIVTGEEEALLPDARRSVECIAISKEGLLAIKSVDAIDLWNMKTRTKKITISSPGDFMVPESGNPLVFSSNGRVLALGGVDGKVSVWDVDKGCLVNSFSVHAAIQSIAVNSDGRILATASDEKMVRIWDVQAGSEVCRLSGAKDTLRCVAFSPDDKFVAAGGFDNAVRVWRWETDVEPWQTLTDAASSVMAVLFSEDNRTLFSGDGHGVRVWDVETWQQRFRFESSPYIYHLAMSTDAKTLAGGSSEGPFEVWRFAEKQEADAVDW